MLHIKHTHIYATYKAHNLVLLLGVVLYFNMYTGHCVKNYRTIYFKV